MAVHVAGSPAVLTHLLTPGWVQRQLSLNHLAWLTLAGAAGLLLVVAAWGNPVLLAVAAGGNPVLLALGWLVRPAAGAVPVGWKQ